METLELVAADGAVSLHETKRLKTERDRSLWLMHKARKFQSSGDLGQMNSEDTQKSTGSKSDDEDASYQDEARDAVENDEEGEEKKGIYKRILERSEGFFKKQARQLAPNPLDTINAATAPRKKRGVLTLRKDDKPLSESSDTDDVSSDNSSDSDRYGTTPFVTNMAL